VVPPLQGAVHRVDINIAISLTLEDEGRLKLHCMCSKSSCADPVESRTEEVFILSVCRSSLSTASTSSCYMVQSSLQIILEMGQVLVIWIHCDSRRLPGLCMPSVYLNPDNLFFEVFLFMVFFRVFLFSVLFCFLYINLSLVSIVFNIMSSYHFLSVNVQIGARWQCVTYRSDFTLLWSDVVPSNCGTSGPVRRLQATRCCLCSDQCCYHVPHR